MSRLAGIKTELRRILGPEVGVGIADPKAPDGALLPEEQRAMARAVKKRLHEFTSGRLAARQAMAELSHPPAAIPMAPDRSPVWPDGLVGSITHSDDICIAAVAQSGLGRSIGIDIEPDTPLDPDLEEVICTPSERDWLDTQPSDRRGYLAKQIFCMKESVYKALYPLTGQVIGFDEVEIEFPARRVTFAGKLTEFHAVTRLTTIRNSIFAYANLTETPLAHGTGSYR